MLPTVVLPVAWLRARLNRVFRKETLLKFINFYPPYVGAGVRVKRIAPDFQTVVVELKLRWWNVNYVGAHFGGSLYALCDPFFMLMLMKNLGSGYVVWDKAASIRYRRPGRSTVRATFQLSSAQLAAIRQTADEQGHAQPCFTVQVIDQQGEVVAEVEKVLSVRPASPPR